MCPSGNRKELTTREAIVAAKNSCASWRRFQVFSLFLIVWGGTCLLVALSGLLFLLSSGGSQVPLAVLIIAVANEVALAVLAIGAVVFLFWLRIMLSRR